MPRIPYHTKARHTIPFHTITYNTMARKGIHIPYHIMARQGKERQGITMSGMILGAKFHSWDNFSWFFPKNIFYSKNDSPKFYRIKLFYLKNHQNFIQTI
jgi:hypothetical protein